MTHSEFAAWLDGFLDGKLSPEDAERVRMKALEVAQDVPGMAAMPAMPALPSVWYFNPLVMPCDTFNPWVHPPFTTCVNEGPLEWSAVSGEGGPGAYQS